MELIAWVQVCTALSIIATIKELIHSQEGNKRMAVAYSMVAFGLMVVSIYLTWFRLH